MKTAFPVLTAALLCASLAHAQDAASQTAAPTQTGATVTSTTEQNVLGELKFEGFTIFSEQQLRDALASRLGVGTGASVTTAQLEDARQKIAKSYLEIGFPAAPTVTVKTTKLGDKLNVTFSVDEAVALKRVEVVGVTALTKVQLNAALGFLSSEKTLTPASYDAALGALVQAYRDQGYAVTVEDIAVTMNAGVLRFAVSEPRIAEIDISALSGITAGALKSKAGQLLRMDTLNEDLRTLSNATTLPLRWDATANGSGGFVIAFTPVADLKSERIEKVVVKGNNSVSAADISKVLISQVGDTASPQLTRQDFFNIQKLYDQKGYALAVADDSVTFDGGVLTFSLREVVVDDYTLNWPDNKVLLRESVVRHILPAPGSVFNREQMRQAFLQLQRYDGVGISGQQTSVKDEARPERVTVGINFSTRRKSAPVGAEVSYNTQDGLGASAGFGTNNFLATGHSLSLKVGANASDVNDRFSGSVNYTVPWIEADLFDFRKRPTSLDLGVWSTVSGNNALTVKGTDGVATSEDTGRQYSVRSTGASVTLGRDVTPNLGGSLGVAVTKKNSTLEPYKASDSTTVTDANRATYQSDAAAQAQLPLSSLTALTTLAMHYDKTDAPIASFGVRASSSLGYGFGSEGTNFLSWAQLEGGASAYQGFGRTLSDGSKQDVFAVRLNAGGIVGRGGESNVFRIGTGSFNPAYELRGYSNTQYGTAYVTSSAELRHNFDLFKNNREIIQGVYALAFADAGTAWTPGSTSNAFKLSPSFGLGAQLNTSFLSVQATYGWTSAGNGRFSVRLGNFW